MEDYVKMRLFRYSKQTTHNKSLSATIRKTAFTIFATAICLSTANAAKTYADAAVSIEQNDEYTDIADDNSLKVYYNKTLYDNNTFPGIRVDDVWMVPVKEFLSDELGCTYYLSQNDTKLTITNKYGNKQIQTYIGSTELTVGSSVVNMDEPVIKARNSENTSEETIYVPASKVIQNLGYGYESTATSLNVTDIISYYKKSDQIWYEDPYTNAINSIICTKNSDNNAIVQVSALNQIKSENVSVTAGDNSIEYIYAKSKNLLGDIKETISDSDVIKSLEVWEDKNSATHIKVTFDGKYITNKSISSNVFTLTFTKASFSMKTLIPDGVNAAKITATDRYWNKQFYIIIPGNHVSFYKTNKPINNSSAIKKIAVNKTSNGDTRIIVTTTKLQGYKIDKKDGYFTVKVGSPNNIYKNIILLDAGHGGKDSGARFGSLYEKNLNLEILYTRARKYFESNTSNVKAYWTRHNDTFINLYTRPKLSKTYNADMFLSLHMNSASNRSANGTEVYYSSRNNKVTSTGLYSKKMASMMLNSVLDGVNSKNRGVRQAGFVVNKYNTVPSVLVELGFITGNKDYPNLKKAAYREKAAKALYDGVEKIFKKYPAK